MKQSRILVVSVVLSVFFLVLMGTEYWFLNQRNTELERANKTLTETINTALEKAKYKADVASFKADATAIAPDAIAECDQRSMTDTFIAGERTGLHTIKYVTIDRQSCGQGNDTFLLTVQSAAPLNCVATVTEIGTTFSGC